MLGTSVNTMDRHSCPTCKALLEVINTEPLELDWIYYDEYYDSNGKAKSKTPKVAKCPLCRDDVFFGTHARVGSIIMCSGCEAQLEVVSLIPPELDWLYNEGYEYYYQDDDLSEEYYDDPLT
jgi:hypothetical protein